MPTAQTQNLSKYERKSFFAELDKIFYYHARRPIKTSLQYVPEMQSADFVREDAGEHALLRIRADARMEELGIKPRGKYGIKTDVLRRGAPYETHAPKNKVMDWVRKVDGEAVAGKQEVSYVLKCGPFSLQFGSNSCTKVNLGSDLGNLDDWINRIINQNKVKEFHS